VRGEKAGRIPELFSRELRQCISVVRGFFFGFEFLLRKLSNGNCDLSDATGDDESLFEMNFQTEPDIDAAQFQKTAAKRAACKSGLSEFREETAATNQYFACATADDVDFVSAVFGANG
jgi:hypothetical protein